MKTKDITLKDYFAAHALTGLLSNPNIVKQDIFINKRPYYYSLIESAIEIGEDMVETGEDPTRNEDKE